MAAGGDDGHPVDARPARLDRQLQAFGVVVTQLFGRDFGNLVAAQNPAQLHVDPGLALGQRINRHQRASASEPGCGSRGAHQAAAGEIGFSRHAKSPEVGGPGCILMTAGCTRKNRFVAGVMQKLERIHGAGIALRYAC